MKIWSCKIGACPEQLLPAGADAPMRVAVMRAYRELTGLDDVFCFSGWGATLDEGERAVVEHRAPSEEYERQWHIQRAAPELYEALRELHAYLDFEEPIRAEEPQHFDDPSGINAAYARALAALAKARGETP